MKRSKATDSKSQNRPGLHPVEGGETSEVVARVEPTARLRPDDPGKAPTDGELEQLVHSGIVTRAARAPDRTLLRRRPIPCRRDIAQAVVRAR
jgi:hypothetical protein